MTDKLTARHAALKILHKTFTQDAYANLALNEILQKNLVIPADRRLTTELVYGTVKNKLLLQYWLKKFVPKFDGLPPWIALNLELAVYQLRFMDKIPASAAVDEAVKLAKRYGHKGTVSLTNGVLRNLLRTSDAFDLPKRDSLLKFLSITYSHPEWMVDRFLKLFGETATEQLLEYDNKTPPLTVRVNILKTTREELIKRLTEDGVNCKPGKYSPFAIDVQGLPPLHDYNLFKEGFFQVQDESSMLAASVVDPQAGETVFDVCAAPGGKATHLAQLMGNSGKVVAFDVHEHKIKLINDNARRLGLNNLQAVHLDARLIGQKFQERADRILVDAPCSGLGVLRRRPDARWRKDIKDIKALRALQLEILESAAKLLKNGGVLVYSTCTILPEENEQLIAEFLTKNKDFSSEDLTSYLPVLPERNEENAKKGYINLYPYIHNTDGFFISRLRRR